MRRNCDRKCVGNVRRHFIFYSGGNCSRKKKKKVNSNNKKTRFERTYVKGHDMNVRDERRV